MSISVRSKSSDWYVWLLIVSYLVFIGANLSVLHWGDDALFSRVAYAQDLFGWWLKRYMGWSGRASIDLLTITTILHEWVWRLLIPLSILLSAYSIVKITSTRVESWRLLLVLVLLSVGPVVVASVSMFWVTGFYNYLLPCALALYCFSVLQEPNSAYVSRVLALLSVFIFSYQEQVAILFGVALVMSLYQSRTRFKWLISLLFLINAAVLFGAPGNAHRLAASYWLVFPQYQDFGLVEKILLGVDKLYQAFVQPDNWPVIVFLGGVCFLSQRKGSLAVSERVSLAIILSYIAFFFVQHQQAPYSSASLVAVPYTGGLATDSVSRAATYVCYFYALMVMFSSLILLLGLLSKYDKAKYALLSVLLAAASAMVVGFSPTVYESGYRVDLMFELGIIIAALYLLDGIKAACVK